MVVERENVNLQVPFPSLPPSLPPFQPTFFVYIAPPLSLLHPSYLIFPGPLC